MDDTSAPNLLDMTADIVSAYVANNTVTADALPGLIASVHGALRNVGGQVSEPEPEVERPSASTIRKSVSDAGIISFIDGKTYQSLKRHLTTNGMTPAEYRERYGLRADYPMVAPAYAAKRSALAKSMGLGQGGRKRKAAAPARGKSKK